MKMKRNLHIHDSTHGIYGHTDRVAPPFVVFGLMLADWLRYILQPGVGPGLWVAVNATLLLVVASLVFTMAVGHADIHTVVLGTLTVGLVGSVNWCAR